MNKSTHSNKQCRLGGLLMTMILVFGVGELSAQQLEEIVVTAQKREQNVQDVPIAITTLSGDEIRNLGFKSAADIQYQTPGLIVSYSSTNAIPNFVLRGVGLNDFTAIQSSPVAIHVDEIYYGNSTLLNFALFDVERVEVLKGPQGTLFGRNTTGGAVNFFSAKPTDELSANLDLGAANYSNFTAEGYVNVPLSDNLLSRLSMQVVEQNGGPFDHLVHGEIGEQEKYAFRGQLLWDASEKLTAHLTVFGGQDESEGNQYQGIPTYGAGCVPANGTTNCSFDDNTIVPIDDNDPFTLQSSVINRDDISAFGSSLNISYELIEGLTLTSVTGHNKVDRKSQEDADGSPQRNVDVGYETDFEQFSEELRLSSVGQGRWDWTLGAYYSTDTLDTPLTETDLFGIDFGRQNHSYVLETDSFAVFLHNEFQVTEPLSVFGGLRYTYETRDFRGGTTNVVAGVGPSSGGDFVPSVTPATTEFDAAFLDREITFKEISWTVGASLDISDQAMVYAKIANGFKSGGFIGDITDQTILQEPYDEETLTAYEIGLKSDWLGKTLRWNTSVFYYDYQDVILTLTVPSADNPVPFDLLINENGADADVYGIESDIWLLPTEGLDIKFGFIYLDTETTAIPTSPFSIGERLDGNELVYAPKFSANGLVRYEAPIANGWLGFGQFDFTTRTKHWAEATNVDVSRIEGYTLLNARVGIGSAGEKWQISAWIKNIADEQYTQYVNDLSGLGAVLITPGYPRTYGLNLSLNF